MNLLFYQWVLIYICSTFVLYYIINLSKSKIARYENNGYVNVNVNLKWNNKKPVLFVASNLLVIVTVK
jgi:hypothetical protein